MIGVGLRKIRKRNKLTLKQVSTLTGLSVTTISRIERNESQPTKETINELCCWLETTEQDLMYESLSVEYLNDKYPAYAKKTYKLV